MTEIMTIEKATELLKDEIVKPSEFQEAGLDGTECYISFNNGNSHITLDGNFSSEDLIAIAVYMDHHNK